MNELKNTIVRRLSPCFQRRNLLTLAGVCAVIALLLTGLSTGSKTGDLLLNFAINFIFSFAIGMSIFLFIQLTNATTAPTVLKKGAFLTGSFVFGGVLGTIIAVGLLKAIWQEQAVIENFADLLTTNIFLAVIFGVIVTSYFVLHDRFHEAAAKLAAKEINEQRLLRLKTKAELEALRAKINPHFLFNTLNSVASLIPENPTKAEEMVQKLAHVFRHTLDASNKEFVTLAEELETIRQYLDIEKVRLGKRLTFEIAAEEELGETEIPGLLLQPLVENCIIHGISDTRSGGKIYVNCSRSNGFCNIEICDSGNGFQETETTEGFGLTAVKDRLSLAYSEEHLLSLENDDGFKVTVKIPL